MSDNIRCAIYTRKSSEEGLDQEFNSLDAQRLSGENYIKSQSWLCLKEQYNDGGYSGGNIERPALNKLLYDIKAGKIDMVLVYKIDRLSRSLVDFSKIIELFEKYNVNFVSVTQSFNTANSMGRLMLNVLLSFAQYEREITGERISDKIRASKEKGMWMGGYAVLGYKAVDKKLEIEESEANIVRTIYNEFIKTSSIMKTSKTINKLGYTTKVCKYKSGRVVGGHPFDKKIIRGILENPIYIGKTQHKGKIYDGQHVGIIDIAIWEKAQKIFHKKKDSTLTNEKITMSPLLKSLIVCAQCNSKFLSVYSAKDYNRKHYRYYTCNKKLRGGSEFCDSARLPANQIEEMIVQEILQILQSPETVVHTLDVIKQSISKDVIAKNFKNITNIWDNLFPIEQVRIVKLLVHKIVIGKESLDIKLYRQGLGKLALELSEVNDG